MTLDQLIDAFVARVNASARAHTLPDEVPVPLRVPAVDEFGDEDPTCTAWRVVRADHTLRIAALERRIGHSFPPSFRSLIHRYAFPAFECGPLTFFANTGEPLLWELQDRLFRDPTMSPFLLESGYLQIGNPQFYDYDPICLEARPEGVEGAVVQIDHEAILCDQRLVVRRMIAPGFAALVQDMLATNAIRPVQ